MVDAVVPDAVKVLIYATWNGRLLVFDEPDFPEVALQVPGGTVEPGEAVDLAARREFIEETGLDIGDDTIRPLDDHDYRFAREGLEVCHRRHYFHVLLQGQHADSWIHQEMTPFSGGGPIRFRLHWVTIDAARASLGYGMADFLERISG